MTPQEQEILYLTRRVIELERLSNIPNPTLEKSLMNINQHIFTLETSVKVLENKSSPTDWSLVIKDLIARIKKLEDKPAMPQPSPWWWNFK